MSENTLQKDFQNGPGDERADDTTAPVGQDAPATTRRKRKTRRYPARARRCKLASCGVLFTPANTGRHAKYCCEAHRILAWRERQRRKPRPAPKPVELVESTCAGCGRSFLVSKARFTQQKFCTVRCRERARRRRRRAAPQALAAALGISAEHTFDICERAGLALVTAALAGLGWVWTGSTFALEVELPAPLPAAFVQHLHSTIDELVSEGVAL